MSTDLIAQRQWIQGRRYSSVRKVRLGDVRPDGHLRLDALTRYTQDVSDDDTTDAGLANRMAWVVRSTMIDVMTEAVMGEQLTFTTFCSATGKRWAERRITVIGENGAHYEVATLWISVDAKSGRPTRLSDDFFAIYGEATAGRTVTARLSHPAPGPLAARHQWNLRYVDFDIFNHVNNAAYWAVVEEHLWGDGEGLVSTNELVPFRGIIEYGPGIARQSAVVVATETVTAEVMVTETTATRTAAAKAGVTGTDGATRYLWWLGPDDEVLASGSACRLGRDLYVDPATA